MSDSIWKKEISFSRKPKAAKPEDAAVAPEQPTQPKQSLLKKELSFSRKPKAPKEPTQPQAEAAPKQSIWKKDLSFSRAGKKQDAPATDDAVSRLVELATQAVAPDFAGAGSPGPVAPPTQLAEAVVAASASEPAPVAADTHPVEALPVDAPVAQVYDLPTAAPVAPAPPVAPPVAQTPPAPAAPPADYHVTTAPVEGWMEPQPQQPEPWLADAPTGVVLHPPVPAADLPPLPAGEASQPFWKKELSFSRKPKAPKEPKAAGGKQPFWKKELSFSRGAAAPVPMLPSELAPPAEPKTPFWKKQLSFGGAKTPKAAKAPKAPRSFSLPQLSLPSLSRSRGGKSGGHQVKRLVGLKVGGSQLAAARIANNGSAELLQVARQDLEAGVVVSGELRDPDTLAESLRTFFAANKLPRKNVRLGIASNRIGVRTFDIAGIDDAKQLENAIHFRAQEALPIPLDEAVLDYHILEESTDAEGNTTKRVLLVVAYRELVDRYVSACKKAGITLAGIDLEAFALLRALSAPRPQGEPTDSALVAVAIGHDRSTFAVSDGRVCEFTRVLEWGGAALNVAIARALDLAPSEAEGIKRAVSLVSSEVPQGITQEQYALALDAVRKQVQTFARELVSSLQFYQNQPGSLGIGEIVITGGTAGLVGLADELQRLIGVRVRVGDPLARLKLTKKIALEEPAGSLAVAIGLGIED